MIRRSLPALFLLASVAAMASQPRFLGPPVKKPADAGAADPRPDDAGAGQGGADAGAQQGQGSPAPASDEPADSCDREEKPPSR